MVGRFQRGLGFIYMVRIGDDMAGRRQKASSSHILVSAHTYILV